MSEWSRKILALWRELLVQQWDGRPSGRGGIGGGGGKGGWAEDWRRLWLRYQKTYYIREPRGTCRLMAHMRHGRFLCECTWNVVGFLASFAIAIDTVITTPKQTTRQHAGRAAPCRRGPPRRGRVARRRQSATRRRCYRARPASCGSAKGATPRS
jgi:hypothetical protein